MFRKISISINYINLLSALWLTAGLIYQDFAVFRLAYFIFFLSFVIEIFTDKKWSNINFDNKKWYYIVLGVFFLLALIDIPFDDSPVYLKHLLEKRLSLLGFAIVGFFGVNKYYKLNYFLNTIFISTILTTLYILFRGVGIQEFISNPERNEAFNLMRSKYVNSHMIFNFFLNISLISVWYILTRSWNRTIWWKRYLYVIGLTIIFSTLSISEGRTGFVVGILLMFSFIFFEIWKRRKVVGIIVALMIPVLLIGIASQHKRMSVKSVENEPRWFLWQSAVSVIKESPIWGVGISDAQEKFDLARPKYQTEEYRLRWIDSKIDSHSQYLQTTMEFGIFGLLILLFLYAYPVFIAENNRKLFSFFILFLCAYQSVFDMFITGPFSAIFGILMILVLSVENNIVQTPEQALLED